jgi:hypothetical protein
LQYTAKYCKILQITAKYCKILQKHYKTLQNTATYRKNKTKFCKILQNAANTAQFWQILKNTTKKYKHAKTSLHFSNS